MDGNFVNALFALHRQWDGCQCVRNNQPSCPECDAVMAAIQALETLPHVKVMSESIESSFHQENTNAA